MLYNLVQYLRTNFPTKLIYADKIIQRSTQNNVPDELVIVKESGGIQEAYYQWVEQTIQIICRSNNLPDARKLGI